MVSPDLLQEFKAEYFIASLVAEIHYPLILLAYILKQVLSSGLFRVSFPG